MRDEEETMPVAKGAALDPAATRARVLDAATRLFYARGVHAVGVNDIAVEAGASKLSLYRNFGSKQRLVAAMLVERSERVHAWLRRETADAPPGEARVLAVFDLLATWFAQADYRGCVVVNTVTDTRAQDPEVAALGRAHLDLYRELLAERLAELDPPPAEPARLARQLLLLIEGATTVATIDSGDVTPGADARDAARILIRSAPRR
ncbi:TetR/AcrR family transcriptional regulator [Actinoallomurus acaciae]|uniref:TetR/AcrR family transcriptional regulator n=1 Tax=Actinoallomurus acaciae TaxID=502577 RepID=A0ABV5YRR8_9ACTN